MTAPVTPRRIATALAEFDDRYGELIRTALRAYGEQQRGAAEPLQAGYDRIKDDPEARVAQDQTMVTTEGLATMALMLRQSADRGDEAASAYGELTDLLDGLDL